MSTSNYKTLGQVSPAATTLTAIYTVPAATQTTISSIIICNTNSTASSFSVSVAIGGASDTTKQYIYSLLPIQGNDTFIATIGLTLSATDVVRVYAANTNLAFSIYGVEIS